MKDGKIQQAIAFSQLIHAFQRVERRTHVPGVDRYENDAEHSFGLAMLAWYLVDSLELALDKKKIFEYALAHDFVEVYAGDTWSFDTGKDVRVTKKQRESDAQKRIASEFPEFKPLHEAIFKYEEQHDPESKFVYALDKIMPILAGYSQGGRDWKELNVSFDEVLTYKREKINSQKEVREIFENLMNLMDKNRKAYFNS